MSSNKILFVILAVGFLLAYGHLKKPTYVSKYRQDAMQDALPETSSKAEVAKSAPEPKSGWKADQQDPAKQQGIRPPQTQSQLAPQAETGPTEDRMEDDQLDRQVASEGAEFDRAVRTNEYHDQVNKRPNDEPEVEDEDM